MINVMDVDMSFLTIKVHISVSTKITRCTEKAFLPTRMVRYMTVNGARISNKVTELGKALKVSPTLENGKVVKSTAMASTYGRMETDLKVNGKTV